LDELALHSNRNDASSFDYAVIDELQDLSIPPLRFLSGIGRKNPDTLFLVGNEGDPEEVYNTERQPPYVACTRARDYLLVSAVEPGS